MPRDTHPPTSNTRPFGRVWAASGALGFFGEGYWFHRVPGLLNTHGITFVAKTTTTYGVTGNMPLNPTTWKPRHYLPRCIWTNPWKAIALNADGLSNFGIEAALATGRWQARSEPFQLSWMPMPGLPDTAARLADARAYVAILKPELRNFNAPVGLQLNISCPNTDENLSELIQEAVELIHILSELEIPIWPKINVLTSPDQVHEIYEHAPFAGVVVSNTLPWGSLHPNPNRFFNWHNVSGKTSPLTRRGLKQAGGLSGAELYPLVNDWIIRAIQADLPVPVNWCGGIMSAADARTALAPDIVESISLGTIMMVRPWRVQPIVKEFSHPPEETVNPG